MKYLVLLSICIFISIPAQAQKSSPVGVDVLQLQISDLENIVKSQTNTIEKLINQIDKMKEQIENLKADVDIRITDIEKQQQPNKIKETPVEKKEEIQVDNSVVKKIYDKGIELVRIGKYSEAQAKFEEFLKLAPKNELAGNAKYWLGETYYARRDYANAAVIFAQGFKDYPQNIKAPDNLLKLGISMQALHKKEEACTAFISVSKEFPSADKTVLEKAEKEIKKLKCQ